MRLLEHEAKAVLKGSDLPIPSSQLITNIYHGSLPVVLKSQVPVGGRGKAGGIKIVSDKGILQTTIDAILALPIQGYLPKTILAEEVITIERECYLSLLIDRDSATIRLIAHPEGGVEVEQHTTDFLNIPITLQSIDDSAQQAAARLQLPVDLVTPFIAKLFATFIRSDATLIEINPLILTKNNSLICGDCKMELDDSASFRHPDWKAYENQASSANFVILDPSGTIATIANGAGLAMATVDAVAAHGMKPANFLDIGGGATAGTIIAAFSKIMEFPDIKAIVINIFAGITRCDEVAKAILEAKKSITKLPPLYIRLAGTNFEDAVSILASENIPTLATLEECLLAAKAEVTHE
ncbi:MAG: hypothetical protein HZB75_00035 [Candidatus Saccharibacteria bacterium]|nr:MAG: hypothetical protein HZB75_00035 [Candidatus Saccharibacteria bacterium]